MPLFTVDATKCGLCGRCVEACPAGLVGLTPGSPGPIPIDRGDGACFDCGHCVAACPTGAFAHRNASPEACLPIPENAAITAEQVGRLMRGRRSIRNFTGETVDRETMEELLDIARYAPSGCNAQPVHWLVLHDTSQVRRVSELTVAGLRQIAAREPASALSEVLRRLVSRWDEGIDVVARGAPHLILAYAPKDDPLAPSACVIAQTYLELAADAYGFGTCRMGLIDMTANAWPPLRQFLSLPADHVVWASMAIGRPAFPYVRIPPRKPLRITWR